MRLRSGWVGAGIDAGEGFEADGRECGGLVAEGCLVGAELRELDERGVEEGAIDGLDAEEEVVLEGHCGNHEARLCFAALARGFAAEARGDHGRAGDDA